MDSKPNELEKPAGAVVPADEAEIHTIPEKFYGAALKKKVHEMAIKTGVTPPGARTPPPPGQTPPPGTPAPKKQKKWLLIAIPVAVFILIGGGTYFALSSKKKSTQIAANIVASICGDRKCDMPSESPLNCSADCGPPPAICGDKKCDATESAQSCPGDCVPLPVCGDSKCDATESLDSCPADCKPPEPKPSKDTDSDGLSDQEEVEVYGSNPNDPNTDKDSFIDLNEVLNLFDPAKPTPAFLKDNPRISLYSNVAQHLSIFRPTAWTMKEDGDSQNKQVLFSAPSGEFVEVLAQDKLPTQTLMEWYLAQSPGATSSQVEPLTFKTRQGYDAVLSADQMTVYVDFGNKAMVVTYNLGKQLEIQYRSTFKMMVHSLKKML